MKLTVFHHNGQLAEFALDAVTGLKIEGEHALEELEKDVQALNQKLHALIDKPGVAPHVTVVAPPNTPLITKKA